MSKEELKANKSKWLSEISQVKNAIQALRIEGKGNQNKISDMKKLLQIMKAKLAAGEPFPEK